ncbi:MAG: hypothetical protein IJ292_01460 [Clostridia bacterium]|jgi:stage IV sporulation protein FB|nr:hypothetical protein [Clostridia bacterium]
MADKTRIKIALPTLVFFCAILFFDVSILPFIPFFAAILHEAGHIAVMKICKVKIKEIKILPFGIDIKKENKITSYKTDIAVSSAGIAVNILLLLLCTLLPKTPETILFASSNVLLIFINILPINSLDGGQMLEKLLEYKYDPQIANKVTATTSLVCITLLGSVAIWVLFKTSYNFSLLLMCIYLFCGIIF